MSFDTTFTVSVNKRLGAQIRRNVPRCSRLFGGDAAKRREAGGNPGVIPSTDKDEKLPQYEHKLICYRMTVARLPRPTDICILALRPNWMPDTCYAEALASLAMEHDFQQFNFF